MCLGFGTATCLARCFNSDSALSPGADTLINSGPLTHETVQTKWGSVSLAKEVAMARSQKTGGPDATREGHSVILQRQDPRSA